MRNYTEDLSIFKKHESNRGLVEKNVLSLMASIQSKNMLELRPILVNSRNQVIDGQHRLEACKRLGIGIYYDIDKKLEVADIVLLNSNQSTWSRSDYLNFYKNEGHEEYIKLHNFIETNDLPLQVATALVGDSIMREGKIFKSGGFKFPTGEKLMQANLTLSQINQICDLIHRRGIGMKSFLKQQAFWLSLVHFLQTDGIDFHLFLKRMELKLDIVKGCTKVTSYIEIWKNIWNFNNRSNRLELDDIGRNPERKPVTQTAFA